ncbi:MAG: right-handed parallel beta-helix repeat-containing protein [Cyclobacteriaceae bacterium]
MIVIKKLFIIVFLATNTFALAKDIYVDVKSGSDTNPGTLEKPFRTIQTAADNMVSGDTCYIRAGVYRETVTPKSDGLTFKNFENEYVLITGLDVITGWQLYDGGVADGIMKAPSKTKITQVFVDGKRMNWARYPDEDGDMLSTDELDLVNIKTEQPTGLVTFERMEAKPDDYWVGAYFMGLPTTRNWWTGHRGKVESSSGKTITCTELSVLWKNPNFQFTGDGAGYIIGHLNALDAETEWHWQDNTLYLLPPNSADVGMSIIEGRTRTHGFNLTNKNGITLEGLHFKAADIHMPEADNCTISKCTVRYGGPFETFYAGGSSQREAWGDFENGASCIFVGGDNNVIRDCYVGYTWTHGFSLWGNNNRLENSIAEQCNWQGERLSPIWSAGDDNKIIRNTSRYGGRDGIELGNRSFGIKVAHRALVQYNHIHHHGYLVPDAGLFYANHQGTSPLAESEVSYNILHDFVSHHRGAVGIYLDNSSSGYNIHHNVVWNAHDGIRTRSATENYFINNTIMGVTKAVEVRGAERKGAVIVTKNNLVNSDETLYGITKSHNLVANVNEFTEYAGRDFSLQPGASAIDAGIDVKGITDDAVGQPDIGAIEYGKPKWTVGASIRVPVFPDEVSQLEKRNSQAGDVVGSLKAKRGKLLFSDDFERAEVGSEWIEHFEKISITDGKLISNQVPGKHAVVARHMMELQNTIFEFDFLLAIAKRTVLVVNGDDAHVFHVSFQDTDEGMQVSIRDYPAGTVTKANIPLKEKAKWHRATVVLAGDQVEAILNGNPAVTLKSSGLTADKKLFQLYGDGQHIEYDNVQVWSVAP